MQPEAEVIQEALTIAERIAALRQEIGPRLDEVLTSAQTAYGFQAGAGYALELCVHLKGAEASARALARQYEDLEREESR